MCPPIFEFSIPVPRDATSDVAGRAQLGHKRGLIRPREGFVVAKA